MVANNPPDTSLISIIVPTRRGCARLADLLDGIASQGAPENLEVILVDDGSVPRLEAGNWIPGNLPVRLVRQENRGAASARNHGAREAAGVELIFLDDDCVPQPGWLSALLRTARDHPNAAVAGVNATTSVYASTSDLLLHWWIEAGGASRRGRLWFVPSNSLCMPAKLFRRMGGFDESFPRAGGEDRDFCVRWIELGFELRWAPDARVLHLHPLTLPAFCRQHFNYGRSALLAHRRSTQRTPRRFFAGLLARPFAAGPSRRAFAQAALLVVSQLATAAGYVFEIARGGAGARTVRDHRKL